MQNIKIIGNKMNVNNKDTIIPTLIIQPKLIIGRILLNTSEAKPAIVVITTKNDGFDIDNIVWIINSR